MIALIVAYAKNQVLPLVEKMYITEIDCDIKGDTYFPHFEKDQFVKEINEKKKVKSFTHM